MTLKLYEVQPLSLTSYFGCLSSSLGNSDDYYGSGRRRFQSYYMTGYRGGQEKLWGGCGFYSMVLIPCPLALAGHLTTDPQCGSSVVGGMECGPGQQPLWCEESIPRLDIRSVCQRSLGPLPVQFPATRELAQALSHSPQLCLAICLHSASVGHASGGPQVRDLCAFLCFARHHFPSYIFISHQRLR